MSIESMIKSAEDRLSAVKRIHAAMQQGGWIPVDQPPPAGVTVLVVAFGEIRFGYSLYDREHDRKWSLEGTEGRPHNLGITHWMPIPEPPPEEKP